MHGMGTGSSKRKEQKSTHGRARFERDDDDTQKAVALLLPPLSCCAITPALHQVNRQYSVALNFKRQFDWTMNTGNPQPPPSPMHPVAPPTKKQRSNQPPMRGGRDALSTAADDAIARRRAELRRLQQKRSQQQEAKGLLDQARTQLGGGGGPPPVPPQQPHHVARARHSDIFPNVTKSVAPPPSSRKPTPRVARRLDPSFEEKRSRSKSAPPMRPPPPPVLPPLVAEAPPERPSPSNKQATPPAYHQQETPSTVHRDTLRNLRDMAPSAAGGSEDIQLARELKLAQDEKADALRKVARLKEQIQQLQKPQVISPQQQQSVSQVSDICLCDLLCVSCCYAVF